MWCSCDISCVALHITDCKLNSECSGTLYIMWSKISRHYSADFGHVNICMVYNTVCIKSQQIPCMKR